jgi:hypothetical protein
MFCRISEDHLSGPGSLAERLRALPSFTPPPGGWARLEARRRARRRRYAWAGGGLALAASVLVAIGVVGLRPDLTPPAPHAGLAQAPTARQEVAQLISRSQNLERQLRSARPQVAVWSSGRDANASLLERRLRVIDAQLNVAESDAAAQRLWRERVRVMNALVDLHESEAPALQYASYQY